MSTCSKPPNPASAARPHPFATLRDHGNRWVSHDLLALGARASMAGVFFLSGRTKVEDWLTVSETAVSMFEN